MNIVVRTRTYPIFLMFFKSFLLFYPERVKDLILLVHGSDNQTQSLQYNDIPLYKELAQRYGFTINLVAYTSPIHESYWADMLYHSLQFSEVVSLDDDIIFLKSGLFDALEVLANESRAQLLAFSQTLNSNPHKRIMNSSFIYKRNLEISPEDFLGLDEVFSLYDGADAGYLGDRHRESVLFLEKFFPTTSSNISTTVHTEYFIHLGSISCMYNETYNNSRRSDR